MSMETELKADVANIINELGQDATFTRPAKTNASATPVTSTIGTTKAAFGKVLKGLVNVPTPNNSAVPSDTRAIYISGGLELKVNDKCTIGSESWVVTSVEPYILKSTTIAIKVSMR
jgi:hypothetical protein